MSALLLVCIWLLSGVAVSAGFAALWALVMLVLERDWRMAKEAFFAIFVVLLQFFGVGTVLVVVSVLLF